MAEVDVALPEEEEAAPVPLSGEAVDDEEDLARAQVAALEGAAPNQRTDQIAQQQIMDEREETDANGLEVMQRFGEFLSEFAEEVPLEDGSVTTVYPYAAQAERMGQRPSDDEEENSNNDSPFRYTLLLNFEHLLQHDVELAQALQTAFVRFEPFLVRALQRFVYELNGNDDQQQQLPQPYFALAVHKVPGVAAVRDVRTEQLGQLVGIKGTVTRTSQVRPELLVGSFRCLSCGLVANHVAQQYHYTRPTICRNPRCHNASPLQFQLETSASEFGDWQKLRVQENSDEIPPGSMPRSMDIILRHEMVERCKAGDECLFVGSLVVLPDGSALARMGEAPRATQQKNNSNKEAGVRGLAALGVKELTYRTCFIASSVWPTHAMDPLRPGQEATAEQVVLELSKQERDEIREMKSSPRLYEQLVESLCPSTFGHSEVKKGILLMLLGGVHKTTMEGIKLRGDINVCVVGDPSTAKSQFLKYVHEFLPSRCVYTSGKASSAAGLTAAVQRDADTGEYCIEAGALMLADNGICCIDEFDKMDPNDQVAIHEAMEQQTISITKAGIQATLNARASILAAANPIYGRYDRTKTLKANVALSAPILSRFDLFFVVLDECNPDADRRVAHHILKVHRRQDEAVKVPFTKEQMQRYIRFARTINPKITPESQRVLVDCYRKLRQGDTLGRSRSAYRITVRQLESMIRLSEALARLYCDQEIRPDYVREAFRLLRTSIIQVETSDVDMQDDDDEDQQDGDEDQGMDDDDDNEETQDKLETQAVFPGEYGGEPGAPPPPDAAAEKPRKKKTKISYEEYESIANAVATHLRSLETDDPETTKHLRWGEIVNWYLEQVEQKIGDSVEELDDMRKKLNLVLRRLVNTDMILVPLGDAPRNKREEQQTILAVHPNYVTS